MSGTTRWPDGFSEAARRCRRCVVLTGAGISAESGLVTFRGMQGLWEDFNPLDYATPEAFERDPAKVWNWYQWRRDKLPLVEPNPGHLAIAELEGLFPEFLLVTQNVDGLHQRAGSRRLVELHGNIGRNKCSLCSALTQAGPATGEVPPRCGCGGLLRPDVVWFGEALPQEAMASAWEASRAADLFFSVGTSGLVQPAASLPVAAKQNGAYLVEVNPEPTPLAQMSDLALAEPAGQAMPAVAWEVRRLRNGKLL